MLGLFFSCSGLLLEIGAVAAGLGLRRLALGAPLTLILHLVGCALLAVGIPRMLQMAQPLRANLLGPLAVFAVLVFMPLLGAIGLLCCAAAVVTFPAERKKEKPWLSVELPELPQQPPDVAARPAYGDGALSAMLRYCDDPKRRLAAVLATRHLRDHHDTEVLRLALTDRVDDVRLLAYSILDHKEQAFNATIKTLQSSLEGATDEQRGKLEQRLAQTYLEMIDLGLCQGEMHNYILGEARRHIDGAVELDPNDTENLYLLGRIALLQGRMAAAESAFLKAQVHGMSLETVLPYLAEIALRQQRYETVTHYLRAIDPLFLHTRPTLSDLGAHWLPEERR